MEKDSDFEANSRRVRLEALAHYCRTALKFFDTGALTTEKKLLIRGPDLSLMTYMVPDLEVVIQSHWLEAQMCQHAKAYLAADIMMGSILVKGGGTQKPYVLAADLVKLHSGQFDPQLFL